MISSFRRSSFPHYSKERLSSYISEENHSISELHEFTHQSSQRTRCIPPNRIANQQKIVSLKQPLNLAGTYFASILTKSKGFNAPVGIQKKITVKQKRSMFLCVYGIKGYIFTLTNGVEERVRIGLLEKKPWGTESDYKLEHKRTK